MVEFIMILMKRLLEGSIFESKDSKIELGI